MPEEEAASEFSYHLPAPSLGKGSQARERWASSEIRRKTGTYRKVMGNYPSLLQHQAGKVWLSTLPGKLLRFPPSSQEVVTPPPSTTVSLMQAPWWRGEAWSLSQDPGYRLGSVNTSRLLLPANPGLGRGNPTQRSSQWVCPTPGGCRGLGKAVGTGQAILYQPVHLPSPFLVTITF